MKKLFHYFDDLINKMRIALRCLQLQPNIDYSYEIKYGVDKAESFIIYYTFS